VKPLGVCTFTLPRTITFRLSRSFSGQHMPDEALLPEDGYRGFPNPDMTLLPVTSTNSSIQPRLVPTVPVGMRPRHLLSS
jgi:hypothetical protein